METIHKNKEAARIACIEYMEKVEQLMEEYGTWEINDDSCVQTWVYTQYLDENGEKQEYCHG